MNVILIPILTRLKQELIDLYRNPDDRCNRTRFLISRIFSQLLNLDYQEILLVLTAIDFELELFQSRESGKNC